MKEKKEKETKEMKLLNKEIKEVEERLKKITTKSLTKLENIEKKTMSCVNSLSKRLTVIEKDETTIKDALLSQLKAFKGIEETFYTLYHNIRKNQFLFAQEPEVWWEDYLDLKEHYNNKNKESKKDFLNYKLTKLLENIRQMDFKSK